jgi:bifunctional UDP-N-acetylglucosamine pyrophosphorylase/glucosamine-1-phosphate N-acetyltransferase
VLNGDVPLLRPETLETLVSAHRQHHNAATLLTAQFPDPTGYGRVSCTEQNVVTEIVEHRDCTPAQRQNPRINAGVYRFNWPRLMAVLPHLQADNDQQEYYLTDVVKDLHPAMAVDVADSQEIFGINSRKQLAEAYAILQDRIKDYWMAAGVTLIDPDSITIDTTVHLEPDVVIEPQTHLRGQTTVGSGSRLGPASMIENSQIGPNVTASFSVITDSAVAAGSRLAATPTSGARPRWGKAAALATLRNRKRPPWGPVPMRPTSPTWGMPPWAIGLTSERAPSPPTTMATANTPR